MTPILPPIELLYEDSDLLIVNKPAGLLTVPGRGPDKQDCLIHRILGHDSNSYVADRYWKNALIVHRLDMATSGIVIIALNRPAQAAMGTLFSERQISKQYIAIVDGKVTKKHSIELPLIGDWDNRPKQKVDHQHGKHAKTNVIPISYCQQSQTSRLQLVPITGRSHQLRVHMLAIGHPIVGDYFYAPEPIKSNSPRLLLHAETIAFIHPVTQKKIATHSPATF